MKCPTCNKKISEDSDFCPFCGQKIIKELICPQCQASNSVDANFCKKCGTPLNSIKPAKPVIVEESDKKEPKQSKFNKEKLQYIFEIVSMSLMFLSVLLMFGLSFIPFLSDDFYPTYSYTVIGYASTAFSQVNYLFSQGRFFVVANAIVLLLLFVAILLLSIIFFAVYVPKFVKNIKEKKYNDFSKIPIVIFALFVSLRIYIVNIALSNEIQYVNAVSNVPLIVLITVPIFLAFNMFTKYFRREEKSLIKIIINASLKTIILVLLFISAFLIGMSKYIIKGEIVNSADAVNTYVSGNFSNVGLIDLLLMCINGLYPESQEIVTSIFVFAGIGAILEIAILCYLVIIMVFFFSDIVEERTYRIRDVVFSALALCFSISILVLENLTNKSVNSISSLEIYGGKLFSTINNGATITITVMSSILLISYIALCIINKTLEKRDETN